MSVLDRRHMLRLAMAALPALASTGVPLRAAESGGTIVPPPSPMVYTRRLERTLVGDARIVVERRFAVRFTRQASGYRVEGEQIGVTVEMPRELAALGELERERVETGIFPLELDANGRIRTGVAPEEEPEIDEAMRYVSQAVASIDEAEDARAAMADFIAAIHEAGSTIIARLPVDLFAPAAAERIDVRSIPLPVGGEGTVETHFTALRDPDTGLLRRARREVVTTIAADERRTTEIFTLGS